MFAARARGKTDLLYLLGKILLKIEFRTRYKQLQYYHQRFDNIVSILVITDSFFSCVLLIFSMRRQKDISINEIEYNVS